MIQLDATTKSLKAILAADADPELMFSASYEDYDQNGKLVGVGQTSVESDPTDGSATAVVLASAPAANRVRRIRTIDVHNADNAASTVSVFLHDGTTNWILAKATLATLETLHYEERDGWRAMDTAGCLKLSA